MKPRLTDDEGEIILENLIHDPAGLDTPPRRRRASL